MKKIPILAFIAIVFIYMRIRLDNTAIEASLVGAINTITLLYIIFDIMGNGYCTKMQKLNHSSYPRDTIQQQRVRWLAIMVVIIILFVFLGIVYFTKYASSKRNDILAIIALYLSIVSCEIGELFRGSR